MTFCFKLFLLASLFTLFSLTHAVSDIRTLLPNNIHFTEENLLRIRSMQQKVAGKHSCNPNVCFALDGSASMSRKDYTAQKHFVELIAAIITEDTKVAVAAVQYGLRNIRISPLTNDANKFLFKVEHSKLARAPRTFISAGLGFCIHQLRPRREDANKIILFGDGRSNFGGNPVHVAKKFLPPKGSGSICAVGIGLNRRDFRVFKNIVGGDRNKVLGVHDYFELMDILDVIVSDICNLH